MKPIYIVAGTVVVLTVVTILMLTNSSGYKCVTTDGSFNGQSCTCGENKYWSDGCKDITNDEILKCRSISAPCSRGYLNCDVSEDNCVCQVSMNTEVQSTEPMYKVPLSQLMDGACEIMLHDCYPAFNCIEYGVRY